MKIRIHDTRVICQNKTGVHNYFAWPSVARLQDGRLAMVASGFRLGHICPFGKGIICYSDNEGGTWSNPAVIIDTPLDDRDCGICTFKDGGVVVTSFNNTFDFQRKQLNVTENAYITEYKSAYIGFADNKCKQSDYLGSVFTISRDSGRSFDGLYRIPVSSPHGPCLLPNGDMLYVGRVFGSDSSKFCGSALQSYILRPDGTYYKTGEIKDITGDLFLCEPNAVVLDNETVIVHIRVQGKNTFTVYQSESEDYGKTFTRPHPVLSENGGAPAHLMQHSDGTLISVYGCRCYPYGIKAMLSHDRGRTWQTDYTLYEDTVSSDLGYPCSVELKNKRILTVFYAHLKKDMPAVIMQTIWSYEQ